MSSDDNCQICKENKYKYCCPKCEIFYCSLKCYKNEQHQKCSEEFYKSCVEEELRFQATESRKECGFTNEAKRMFEILKKYDGRNPEADDYSADDSEEGIKDDSDDEDDENDLIERLKDVNLEDSDAVWSKLTNNERQEFENLIDGGNFSEILPNFQPWWEAKVENKLVEEINSNPVPNKKQTYYNHPKIKEKIPNFKEITSKEPSPCIQNNIANILAAYSCTVRYFNGDHFTSPEESSNHIILLSANLRRNINFDYYEQALKSVIYESQSAHLQLSDDIYKIISDDVVNILEGPDKTKSTPTYRLAALSDVCNLFTTAKLNRKQKDNIPTLPKNATGAFSRKFSDNPSVDLGPLKCVKLNVLVKKIEYYMSYVKSKT